MKMNQSIIIILSFLIFSLLACQDKNVIEKLYFDNTVKHEYQFIMIDSVDSNYYIALSDFVNLDSIINQEIDPTAIAIKLTDYTHNQWKHNGNNTPTKFEGLTILEEAKRGKQFRCVEYSILLTELLNASNIPARQIGLKTKNVETQKTGAGHVAVEYFDEKLQKWIYADAQFNVIAFKDGTPLSSVELQEAIKNDAKITVSNQSSKHVNKFKNWIGKYLYYFDTAFDQRVKNEDRFSYNGKTKLMLVPKGAKEPQKFQINSEIKNVIYTNSLAEFYPK